MEGKTRTNINEVIADFLKEKNKLIDDFVGHAYLGGLSKYITNNDINEIKNWPVHFKIRFIHQLSTTKEYNYNVRKDSEICPWCSIASECDTCTFGARHKPCYYSNSDYNILTSAIEKEHIYISKETSPCEIKSIPGMKELVLKYGLICDELLRQIDNIRVKFFW